MATSPQLLQWAQYEAVTITVTMSSNGSISGQTFAFSVRDLANTLIFQRTSVDGSITITTTGGVGTAGVITIALTSATTQLTTRGEYKYDLWRTNSGSESRIAFGAVRVDEQLRV